MKEITYFYLAGCPFCRQADDFIKQLKEENEAYSRLTITKIEESEQAEYANSFDYYYVPCFYIDGEKLFEGAAKKEDVKKVLDAALG